MWHDRISRLRQLQTPVLHYYAVSLDSRGQLVVHLVRPFDRTSVRSWSRDAPAGAIDAVGPADTRPGPSRGLDSPVSRGVDAAQPMARSAGRPPSAIAASPTETVQLTRGSRVEAVARPEGPSRRSMVAAWPIEA